MEIGMGQHGEGGGGRMNVKTADETAEIMLEKLLKAIQARRGDQVFVMLNGSGATTLMEMFIVYRQVKHLLDQKGIEVVDAMVDEYLTVQEMAGFQMFVAKMDDELTVLLQAPCNTSYWVVR